MATPTIRFQGRADVDLRRFHRCFAGETDNASYHKDWEVWAWFQSNRHWLEVHQLPPYSPELNPTERLWQHTRKNGTHNRFFSGVDSLLATLTRVFEEMQSYPQLIRSYLTPFC